MLLFDGTEPTSILQNFYVNLQSIFAGISWDIILFAGLAFEVLFAIFFIIKSRFSYEMRMVKKLLKLNNWLNKNRTIDQNNLIEFNNMMKATPKHLRYYWHEYMLNRDKSPSYYMSTYNLVEKPLKSSSFRSNIKNFLVCTIIGAALIMFCGILMLGIEGPITFQFLAYTLLTPVAMGFLYAIFVMIMRAGQNMNVDSLYQYVHYFGRFLDRAVVTMPEYVDFEVLFTPKEIKKGIPVLNEYLEKRARQEQEELEKARINAVEHESYDFSSTGINGSLILERAINESETFINIRSRLLSEIQQIEDEMESIKRTYENAEKDYQKKMQVSKENVDRLRKQQEETTNRIENNYIKKQQADEIKKQEQLEKDHDSATLRFNQEIETLTTEISTRRKELEERRQFVENAMKAEYQTFSTKLYKSMSEILSEENQDEKEELLEIKDQIAEDLQTANEIIAEKDDEINQLRSLLQANNIDYNAYLGYSSHKLQKEAKRNKKRKKSGNEDDSATYEPLPSASAQGLANASLLDPNLIPLEQIPESQRQYGEDGGFYDPNGYYRYPNGTYFTPNAEFHDEFGGWYEADGVTYHNPQEVQQQLEQQAQEQKQTAQEGYYGQDGNYYYPNGSYYTPDGRYFDEFGGWYEADGKTYHAPEENKVAKNAQPANTQTQNIAQPTESAVPQQATVRKFDEVPESEREYGEDGGFFDNAGYYYYPNGAYFTPDGRYFDEFGGWYEADGETYHEPENAPKLFDEKQAEKEERKQQQTEETAEKIEKLKDEFDIKEDIAPIVEQPDNQIEEKPSEVVEEINGENKNADEEGDTEKLPQQDVVIDESLFQSAPEESKIVEEEKPTDSETQLVEENVESVPQSEDIKQENEVVAEKPKTSKNRGRGRPKKSTKPVDNAETPVDDSPVEDGLLMSSGLFEQPDENVNQNVKDDKKQTSSKKGRGRPRKIVEDKPKTSDKKRGRGRPKKSVANAKKSGEFDDLMSSVPAPEIEELDKLNEKIADENKRLAEHQEQRDKQLTEALFQLSSDDEDEDK